MYSTEGNLFGWEEKSGDNDTIARAFQQRLKEVAGFKHVPEPLPMKNSKGNTIHYLFFASQNTTGDKIVKDIFKRYRYTTMALDSAIEWTDATWNPVTRCTKVSPGCAEARAGRRSRVLDRGRGGVGVSNRGLDMNATRRR